MTIEDIEKKAEEIAKENFPLDEFRQQIVKNVYKDGYEQGKKDYITNDRSYVIPTKEMSYVEIAKENAELKKEIKDLQTKCHIVPEHYLSEAIDRCNELEKQIEKMKNCQTCKYKYKDTCYLWLSEGVECINKDKWELAE